MWPQVREVMDPIRSEISGPENTAPNLQILLVETESPERRRLLKVILQLPSESAGKLGLSNSQLS